MRRSTVRYAGHCETWSAMIRLGLLRRNGRAFKPGEHDAVVLYDEFEIETEDSKRQTRNSFLFHRGEIGVESAMAVLVGLPAAVAARFAVERRLDGIGVRIPIHPEMYEPILGELRRVGVSVS